MQFNLLLSKNFLLVFTSQLLISNEKKGTEFEASKGVVSVCFAFGSKVHMIIYILKSIMNCFMFWCVRASCLCWQYSLDKEALKSQQKF